MQGNVVFWLFFSQRSPTPQGDPGKPSGLGGFFPIFFSFVPQPSPLPGTAQGNVAEFPLFSQKTSTTTLKSRKMAAFVEVFSSLLHFHGRTFIPVWNHKKNAAFSSGISGFLPKKTPATMRNPGKSLGLVVFLPYFWFSWYNLHPSPKPRGNNAGECGVFHLNCPFSPKKKKKPRNTMESRKTLVVPSRVSIFCPQIPQTGTGCRKIHFLHDFPFFPSKFSLSSWTLPPPGAGWTQFPFPVSVLVSPSCFS